jgi:Fe-Mn family superoxide dismutase
MFTIKNFSTPELKGISKKNIEEHIKLYEGYVKNANLIREHIAELSKEGDKYAYEIAELQRRFAFEFDGMRNHEIYFAQFDGASTVINPTEKLYMAIEKDFGSFDAFMSRMKTLAMTRGVGWAMLYYDKETDSLLTQWVEEQHLGHLVGLSPILAIDMWEHAYVYDYPTSEKKKYIEAFFENLNWTVVEENFEKAQ